MFLGPLSSFPIPIPHIWQASFLFHDQCWSLRNRSQKYIDSRPNFFPKFFLLTCKRMDQKKAIRNKDKKNHWGIDPRGSCTVLSFLSQLMMRWGCKRSNRVCIWLLSSQNTCAHFADRRDIILAVSSFNPQPSGKPGTGSLFQRCPRWCYLLLKGTPWGACPGLNPLSVASLSGMSTILSYVVFYTE